MSKAAIGAKVMYCGHDGWFVADILNFNGVNVVYAASTQTPVTPTNITRGCSEEATHHMSDFPKAGFWCPQRGVFVVPENQVRELKQKHAKRVVQNTAKQLS